jgi:hypothetical protein
MSGVLSDPLLVKQNFVALGSGIESQHVLGSYGNLSHLLLESHNAIRAALRLGLSRTPSPAKEDSCTLSPQSVYTAGLSGS